MTYHRVITIEWNDLADEFKRVYRENIDVCDVFPECQEYNWLPRYDEDEYAECVDFGDEDGIKGLELLKKIDDMLEVIGISRAEHIIVRVDY